MRIFFGVMAMSILAAQPVSAQQIERFPTDDNLFTINMTFKGKTAKNPFGLVYQLSQIGDDFDFLICRVSHESGGVVHFAKADEGNIAFNAATVTKDVSGSFPGILQVRTCAFVDSKTKFIVLDGGGKPGNGDVAVEVSITPLPDSYFSED